MTLGSRAFNGLQSGYARLKKGRAKVPNVVKPYQLKPDLYISAHLN